MYNKINPLGGQNRSLFLPRVRLQNTAVLHGCSVILHCRAEHAHDLSFISRVETVAMVQQGLEPGGRSVFQAPRVLSIVQPRPLSPRPQRSTRTTFVPSDFNYAREPNVDERNKFSRDIYRVEDSQLAEAVGLLEQRCPDAVVRVRAGGQGGGRG